MKSADIDLAGHCSGDEGGATFLEEVDSVLGFMYKGVGFPTSLVKIFHDGLLFWDGWEGDGKLKNYPLANVK